ncbi:FHA domain-containing protein [Planctomicrobium sp. SH661]|uniref:FHA domain-containing protein n=1 Tax=Planctomicrobium sp. SH661 TaxID=3448124 RepID=UPI003F5B6E72
MRHAELKVVSGKQAGSLIPLPEGKFLIGREEDCHLRPNSDTVSRHHCVFTVDEFTVRLRDLGSTNGTLVNGERIRGGVMLNPGDIVSIGKIEFEIQIRDTSMETAAELQLESETKTGKPEAAPAVGEPESSYEIPAATDTLVDIPVVDTVPFNPLMQPPPGDTQFANPMQMPMQPALGYPQMGYPPPMGYPQQMMPYGYQSYPGMYPPQPMGYPMPGAYPQAPMQMPTAPMVAPIPEPEPVAVASKVPEVGLKLPNPEETGAKAPAPKPAAPAGGDQKTAEAKAKEEAPKMADDIIQQYLKRRPSPGGKK